MSTSNIEALLKRVAQPAKKVANARVKFPWRVRKKVKRPTLSKKDKEDAKARRDAAKTSLNDAIWDARDTIWDTAERLSEQFNGTHSARYYYQMIVQNSHIRKRKRGISLWNAFVSKEMKLFNEETCDRKRVSDKDGPIKVLSERWKTMSQEEREAAVADVIPELMERQENRVEGVQNVAINAFNDTRATLANVQRELEALNGRTDTDMLFIAVRSKYGAYNAPYIFYSNDRVAQYTETIAKKTIHEFALGMEGFCLSGVTSLVRNQREELMDLKLKVKTIVFEKMKEASTRGPPAKMYYVNFEDHITARYGLVIENYPLEKFAAPGSFSSVPILTVLYNSWANGITRFREMSNDEWQAWLDAHSRGWPLPTASVSQGRSPDLSLPRAGSVPPPDTGTDPTSSGEASDTLPPPPSSPATAAPSTSSTPAAPAGDAAGMAGSMSTAARTAAVSSETMGTSAPVNGVPPRGEKRPLQDNFINAVAADGSFVVPKRARATRKDKGVKRRPKAVRSPNVENDAPATP